MYIVLLCMHMVAVEWVGICIAACECAAYLCISASGSVCITVRVYALSNNAHNVCVFLHVSVCLHSVNVRFVHVVGGYNCE